MGPTIGIVRWLAVIAAASFFVAALLFLGLTFNVFVKPPDIPASADLPTNLLAAVPAIHAMWPFDAVSSLLFGVGFGALALLGRPLASLVPAGRGGATLIGPALLGGGVLGVAAQLIHVGAQQLVVDIPYCDCGFKVQETISQHWALVLIGGAQSWLTNGAAILLVVGFSVAGYVLADVVRSAGWRELSFLTAAVAVVSVILSALELGGDLTQLLIAAIAAILIPLWAVLLVIGLGRGQTSRADARDDPGSA